MEQKNTGSCSSDNTGKYNEKNYSGKTGNKDQKANTGIGNDQEDQNLNQGGRQGKDWVDPKQRSGEKTTEQFNP